LRAQGHAEDRHRREPTQQQDAACHAAEDTDGETIAIHASRPA
jgi:hypothetical protein